MNTKKLRSHWVYNHNHNQKSDQILEIEGIQISIMDLVDNVDMAILRLVAENQKFRGRQKELKKIIEKFIVDVSSSKDIKGNL